MNNRALIIFCYLTIYIVWGSTYLFIKLGVETIAPFTLVGLRHLSGALLFIIACVITGALKRLPTRREVVGSAFMGIFLLLFGNGFITWSEKKVDSYIAALIISSSPFIIAFFDRVLHGRRITLISVAGITIGVAGVAMVLFKGPGTESAPGYLLLVIAGMLAWSFATSMGRKTPQHPNLLVSTALQLFIAGAIALTASVLFEPQGGSLAQATPLSIASLVFLAIVGSAAFMAYAYLLRHEPPLRIISYSVVNPVIAVLLGTVVAGEPLRPLLPFGVPLVILGLILMLYGDRLLRHVGITPPSTSPME